MSKRKTLSVDRTHSLVKEIHSGKEASAASRVSLNSSSASKVVVHHRLETYSMSSKKCLEAKVKVNEARKLKPKGKMLY